MVDPPLQRWDPDSPGEYRYPIPEGNWGFVAKEWGGWL